MELIIPGSIGVIGSTSCPKICFAGVKPPAKKLGKAEERGARGVNAACSRCSLEDGWGIPCSSFGLRGVTELFLVSSSSVFSELSVTPEAFASSVSFSSGIFSKRESKENKSFTFTAADKES